MNDKAEVLTAGDSATSIALLAKKLHSEIAAHNRDREWLSEITERLSLDTAAGGVGI